VARGGSVIRTGDVHVRKKLKGRGNRKETERNLNKHEGTLERKKKKKRKLL